MNLASHLFARLVSRNARHEQLVVASVLVAHGGGHGEGHRSRVERPTCRAAPGPATSPGACLAGDRLGACGGAAGEQPDDLGCHLRLEGEVLACPSGLRAPPAASPGALVGQAPPLGLVESRLFDEDPLALVAAPRPAEADHNGGEPARLLGAPGESGVARGQVDEVAHVRTGQAQRPRALHDQQVTGARALRAGPVPERHDHHQVWGPALALRRPAALRLGQRG